VLRQPNKENTIMATNNNKKSSLDQEKRLIAGVRQHLMNQSFIVGDKSCTAQEVIAVFQGRVDSSEATLSAKATFQATVKADRERRTQTGPFVRAFRNIVQGMFFDPGTLSDFGLSPRKSTKKTVDTKATAIAKNKATRQARGTKGTKQKAKIHGTAAAAPSTDGATTKAPAAPKPTAPSTT
jgi:hypothetical protein